MSLLSIIFRLGTDQTELDSGLAKARSKISSMAQAASASLAGMFAGGAVLGGLKKLFSEMDRVGKLATRFDETAETIQRVGHAANLAGADMEMVAKALTSITIKSADAAAGGAEYAKIFETLGVNARAFMGMNMEDQLTALASAHSSAAGDSEKQAALLELLGTRAADLIPLLSEGADALKATMSSAAVVAEETVRSMERANDTITNVVHNLKVAAANAIGFVDKIAQALGGDNPYMDDAVEHYETFIDLAKQQLIAEGALTEGILNFRKRREEIMQRAIKLNLEHQEAMKAAAAAEQEAAAAAAAAAAEAAAELNRRKEAALELGKAIEAQTKKYEEQQARIKKLTEELNELKFEQLTDEQQIAVILAERAKLEATIAKLNEGTEESLVAQIALTKNQLELQKKLSKYIGYDEPIGPGLPNAPENQKATDSDTTPASSGGSSYAAPGPTHAERAAEYLANRDRTAEEKIARNRAARRQAMAERVIALKDRNAAYAAAVDEIKKDKSLSLLEREEKLSKISPNDFKLATPTPPAGDSAGKEGTEAAAAASALATEATQKSILTILQNRLPSTTS